MAELVRTGGAVRIMGVWVRRADALLGDAAVANAARAVDERRRRTREDADLLHELDLRDAG